MSDSLTGVYNQRFFYEQLEREVKEADEKNKPLSLIIMDLDNFKRINDAYGHDAGDRALQFYAKLIKDVVRPQDYVARTGLGDELAVICTNATEEEAEEIGEEIREKVKAAEFDYKGYKIKLTLSAGVAQHRGENSSTFHDTADKCLYDAKNAGRDCVFSLSFWKKITKKG